MAAPAGKVPILKSVRAGFDFVGTRWRALMPLTFGGMAAVIAAAALTAGAQRTPAVLYLGFALQALVLGAIYAGYLGAALKDDATRRREWVGDIGRLVPAMAITGFFLFLIMFVALLPGGVVLTAAIMPDAASLNAAAGDPVATSAILERAMERDPAPFLALAGLYVLIWVALTSRLYLVAPATVAEKQVRTFETWAWTKGAMLRIAAARLVLLAPFSGALWYGQTLLVQWAQTMPAGAAPAYASALFIVFIFASLVVLALEAGLSAYLYRGLRPSPAA